MNVKSIIFGTTATLFLFNNVSAKTKVSLKQAFEKKLISAKSICAGGLELNYSITNLIKDSLCITIPAGWRFNSDAGKNDYQDILITHDEILVLRSKEVKTFDIKGFCCEATKGGPQKGAKYTLGKMADNSLVALAQYLKDHPVDQNTQQYSVWAISDNKETANITSGNDSIATLVRSFVANVKGEPQPWYTLLKKSNVSQTGAIYDFPIRFKANITYSVAKTCYSYCYIIDEKGNTVSEIFGKWLQPENYDYKADFNVRGFKKGDYTLVLKNDKSALFEKSFSI
jgi:hypothetical protein